MDTQKIRTRFAPSPTGYMHIGNLRTALYGYLLAKHSGGTFILRIEDTDQNRLVAGATDVIFDTLKTTGLFHDEGPDVGGNFGPYVQSERKEIYTHYAHELVRLGGAYYCFCDKSRLDEARADDAVGAKYDRHCRDLSAADIEKNLEKDIPFVVRQKMPLSGSTSFQDEVFGEISIKNDELDDNVLLKSDGMPTYNFANVVDDHLMHITHIVRGNEYLVSTPKYNLLYQSFGWTPPKYIHVSPIIKEGGKKLSKRDGDAAFGDFLEKGYLTPAVMNYIALLGWSPGDDREIMSLDELIHAFSVSGISKSPAVFDIVKLGWMNGEYIKRLPPEEFHNMAQQYYKSSILSQNIDTKKISPLLQGRCEKLGDIPEMVDFFDKVLDYDVELYTNKKMKTSPQSSAPVLAQILSTLANCNDWDHDQLLSCLTELVQQLGAKNGQVLYPLRIALSGKAVTPCGGVEIAEIIGKQETIRRIELAIAKLAPCVE